MDLALSCQIPLCNMKVLLRLSFKAIVGILLTTPAVRTCINSISPPLFVAVILGEQHFQHLAGKLLKPCQLAGQAQIFPFLAMAHLNLTESQVSRTLKVGLNVGQLSANNFQRAKLSDSTFSFSF